jgi:uncharacterized protein (TIGR02145 family)
MKNKFYTLVVSLFAVNFAFSQERIYLSADQICKELYSDIKNLPPSDSLESDKNNVLVGLSVPVYDAGPEVSLAWAKIKIIFKNTKYAALVDAISVKESPVQDFYSAPYKGTNYILYDATLINQFDNVAGIDIPYILLFSLSHELAHIINGDLNSPIRSREKEEAADLFASKILCSLGVADANKIKNVLQTLAGAVPDEKYPSKGERLKAIDAFFLNHLCTEEIEGVNVRIGKEIWTPNNASFTSYRNGDAIPQAHTRDEWVKFCQNKTGCWCYYNFDSNTGLTYGNLYNSYVITDSRGVAPDGWHLPTKDDWLNLTEYIKDLTVVKLKGHYANPPELSLSKKAMPNIDPLLFSSNPGGYGVFNVSRDYEENFRALNHTDAWWSSERPTIAVLTKKVIRTDKRIEIPGEVIIHSLSDYDIAGLSIRFIKSQ